MCNIMCQIHHHLQIRGSGNFNFSLLLVVYDNSIGLTIDQASTACTFVIDTFSDYITTFHTLPHSFS